MPLLDQPAMRAPPLPADHLADASTFDLAPVSLWLEDLSGLKALFSAWAQAGMDSLHDYLSGDTDRMLAVLQAVRVVKVNRKTLDLFEARDLPDLVANMHRVLSPETMAPVVSELAGMWDGSQGFHCSTFNYTLTGRRLDIQLRGNILPGYEDSWARVLVAVEDVTDLETARREVARSEAQARFLFEHSPVSLWVSDFSGVKSLLEELRAQGVTDFAAFIAQLPRFLDRCSEAIRVLDVNHQTLLLYGVTEKTQFLRHNTDLLRANIGADLREQLIGMWNGVLFQERETVNHTLGGARIHVHIQFSVLPGHEHDWSLVQVARTDMTARKAAEARLEYMRSHDPLTQLRSRSFYTEELRRIGESGVSPVTVIVADLNGLKAANDRLGHAEGDALLRRAGAVLAHVTVPHWSACRIGGDEFVILMPGAGFYHGQLILAEIDALVRDTNRTTPDPPLSLSLGTATRAADEPLEATVSRADAAMYAAKRLHYTRPEDERRAVPGIRPTSTRC